VFEPPLFTKIVAGQPYERTPGCAARYECYCVEDADCAPEFKCVASAALPQFRVCKGPVSGMGGGEGRGEGRRGGGGGGSES
jgi:hypothetical protein